MSQQREIGELNACFVPEGTYQICSKTNAPKDEKSGAEWILNIQWEMKGVDMNFNTRVGKLMSLLVNTLTSLAGDDEEFAFQSDKASSTARDSVDVDEIDSVEIVKTLENLSSIEKRRKIERAMNEQAKLVNDLQQLGANETTIEEQRRKLQSLEALLFRQFQQDMRQKLRKQSQKATHLKNRLGLSTAAAHQQRIKNRRSDSGEYSSGRRYSEAGSAVSVRLHKRSGSVDANVPTIHENEAESVADSTTGSRSTPSEEADGLESRDSPSLPNDDEFSQAPTSTSDDPPRPTLVIGANDDEGDGESSAGTVRWRKKEPSGGSGKVHTAAAVPPAIDLYLDLKIYIDSGQCTFRTKEDEPLSSRKTKEGVAASKSGTKLKAGQMLSSGVKSGKVPIVGYPFNQTVITIPGVNVKSYYASHVGNEGHLNPEVNEIFIIFLGFKFLSPLFLSERKVLD